MVLRLYVHIDETQSLFLAFDLYISIMQTVAKKQRRFGQRRGLVSTD